MIQEGIEIRMILRQSDILYQSYRYSQRERRNFLRIYFYMRAIGYRRAQFMGRVFHLRVCGSQQLSPVYPQRIYLYS